MRLSSPAAAVHFDFTSLLRGDIAVSTSGEFPDSGVGLLLNLLLATLVPKQTTPAQNPPAKNAHPALPQHVELGHGRRLRAKDANRIRQAPPGQGKEELATIRHDLKREKVRAAHSVTPVLSPTPKPP